MYNLALAYEIVDDKEKAVEYYKNALAVQPDHQEAKHNLELLTTEVG